VGEAEICKFRRRGNRREEGDRGKVFVCEKESEKEKKKREREREKESERLRERKREIES
jgi:hypothetical protein